MRALVGGEPLFPGIVGYENTVVPEISLAILAEHDMLFLGEKGQAKSRLMRALTRFLDPEIPYIDVPESPVHDDPYQPISRVCKQLVASRPKRRFPSPGGGASNVMPSGSHQEQSSPTSLARLIRRSWQAA